MRGRSSWPPTERVLQVPPHALAHVQISFPNAVLTSGDSGLASKRGPSPSMLPRGPSGGRIASWFSGFLGKLPLVRSLQCLTREGPFHGSFSSSFWPGTSSSSAVNGGLTPLRRL